MTQTSIGTLRHTQRKAEMTKYNATITLDIDDFDAVSEEEAIEKINAYIDSLAHTHDLSLTWTGCDWTVTEAE